MRLPFRATPARTPALPCFTGGGLTRPLTVRRAAQARRMRLTVDPRDGAVRLTLPARAALPAALGWVATKRGWIEAQLAAVIPALPLVPGAAFPLEGTLVRIAWEASAPRAIALAEGRLRVGGPADAVPARILRWLKLTARERLTTETADCAARAGVAIGRIGIGDPRSRWGSCSSAGDIRYSWRLILAPVEVRRATVAHEVAHRLHMDHSAAFHAAAARLFGRDPAVERRWLRDHGAGLHAIGRA